MKFIKIANPSEINSKKVKQNIESLINSGVKTYEIKLVYEFIAPENICKDIEDKFQVLKNRISFSLKNQ